MGAFILLIIIALYIGYRIDKRKKEEELQALRRASEKSSAQSTTSYQNSPAYRAPSVSNASSAASKGRSNSVAKINEAASKITIGKIAPTRLSKEKARLEQCLYDYVVIDFETTGFTPPPNNGKRFDEIVSVSIIDQDGNILLDSLCKPKTRQRWPNAEEIHGISPAMVKNAPPVEDLFLQIKEILLHAKYVIAYNIEFEYSFLAGYDALLGFPGGTKIESGVIFGPDPMMMYCAYKGQWKWPKLAAVAKHFKYTYEAHNALEDAKATLHCYKKLLDAENTNPEKNIVKFGFTYEGLFSAQKGKWLDPETGNLIEE